MKFAQATRDLEDAFVAEDVYKHNDVMLPDEAICRAHVYGGFLATLVTFAIITSIR